MSRSGRAIELLDEWRDGLMEEHRHGYMDECARCTADLDTEDVIQLLFEIDPFFERTHKNGESVE